MRFLVYCANSIQCKRNIFFLETQTEKGHAQDFRDEQHSNNFWDKRNQKVPSFIGLRVDGVLVGTVPLWYL